MKHVKGAALLSDRIKTSIFWKSPTGSMRRDNSAAEIRKRWLQLALLASLLVVLAGAATEVEPEVVSLNQVEVGMPTSVSATMADTYCQMCCMKTRSASKRAI